MKLSGIVVAGLAVVLLGGGVDEARAQNAAAEKVIAANERAANEAIAKRNLAGFTAHVAVDGWAVDGMMGRAPVADFVKNFDAITKERTVSSWSISDDTVQWIDANTAIYTYKWTGTGTTHGGPTPSPMWASTVWTRKNDKWTAVFHQESISMPAAGKK
jgi:Domain of unknown function (DUF4440)